MKIIVGSKSKHKINAVIRACAILGIVAQVVGVEAPSGVDEQPQGLDITTAGAANRLRAAREQASADDWVIAMESGVMRIGGGHVIDVAILCVSTPTGQEYYGISSGTPFPLGDYLEAQRRGFKDTTVGMITRERTGCDSADVTTHLTGLRVSREDTLVDGLRTLLACVVWALPRANEHAPRVYVASSWRNKAQPGIVELLRDRGAEVYDFRHPAPGDNGFSWGEIDPAWEGAKPERFLEFLRHPAAVRGFAFDMNALQSADATILILPCGKSAHLELGYAVGAGQRTAVLLEEDKAEPELMYKMVSLITQSLTEVLDFAMASPRRRLI